MIKVLFVCHGNICRSTMAESVFTYLVKKQGLDDSVFVDSLEVLAYQTILACGKTPVGFPDSFAMEERS